MASKVDGRLIRELAAECGFELAGVSAATPSPDFERYKEWAARGLGGAMGYLSDHRAEIRQDPESLLEGVQSVISVGMLYNGPEPYSTDFSDPERAWIARYALGEDYHSVIRAKLEEFVHKLLKAEQFSWRICVDTAPLLERSFAREAGLGWIGKNTCLINQQLGSWFFLAEVLTTLKIAPDAPAPERCGTCTRCITACPTQAIVPSPNGGYELDARLCISYFTIELRTAIPEAHRDAIGHNVFGCDICQDVCPWNRKAVNSSFNSRPEVYAPFLERLAGLSESEFRLLFQETPVSRAKYSGFLRNVAVAMGNSGLHKFREPLRKLANSTNLLVREHAEWALAKLTGKTIS